jgi:TPR repeat protein
VRTAAEQCDAGDGNVCHDLGLADYNEGTPNSLRRAANLFNKSCGDGNATGCVNLGIMYENGQGGLARDLTRASQLYLKGCSGGDATGCNYYREIRDAGQSQPPSSLPANSGAKTPAISAALRNGVNAVEVQSLIAAGNRLRDNGTYDDAIASFQKALQLDPSNAAAQAGLAGAQKGKTDEERILLQK